MTDFFDNLNNPGSVRALSLIQPWASLYLSACKRFETRPWPTNYRGWLAIHASKTKTPEFITQGVLDTAQREFGKNWRGLLPRGGIIGAVRIVDCIRTERVRDDPEQVGELELVCGNWGDGRYAIKRTDYVRLGDTLQCGGRQRFFSITSEAIMLIKSAITAKYQREI